MGINKWMQKNTSSLEGKVVAVTGASGGLGKCTIEHLLQLKATVLMVVRNISAGEKIKHELLNDFPSAEINILHLDLADDDSITEFCNNLMTAYANGIDVFINNAGAFKLPKKVLENGLEIHFNTNFLAPYKITKLLEYYFERHGTKVIFVSSLSNNWIKTNTGNLDCKEEKSKLKVYSNSKRWLTLCVNEYKKRLVNDKSSISIEVAHPGVCATNIIHYKNGGYSKWFYYIAKSFMKVAFISPKKASLNIIKAIFINTEAYVWTAPKGLFGIWGMPKTQKIKMNRRSYIEAKRCYRIADKLK